MFTVQDQSEVIEGNKVWMVWYYWCKGIVEQEIENETKINNLVNRDSSIDNAGGIVLVGNTIAYVYWRGVNFFTSLAKYHAFTTDWCLMLINTMSSEFFLENSLYSFSQNCCHETAKGRLIHQMIIEWRKIRFLYCVTMYLLFNIKMAQLVPNVIFSLECIKYISGIRDNRQITSKLWMFCQIYKIVESNFSTQLDCNHKGYSVVKNQEN